MKAIIRREYFALKHNLTAFITTWFLLPMMVYLFISIPFSFYINLENGINYLHWSSIGNWICTSSILSYIISINLSCSYISPDSRSKSLLYSSLSNYDHLLAIGIWSFLIGFIQLFFSFLITLILNSSNLFFLDILLIIIYIIPLILLSSMIGMLIGFIFTNSILKMVMGVAMFLFLTFSCGLFIPLSSDGSNIFLLSPIYVSVSNIQAIISNDPSTIFASLIVLVVSIALFFINIFISQKALRS